MTPPTFVPGIRLAELFYAQAVRPILDDFFPGLVHSAARVGSGSEVLGFDDQRSVDHEWGPRLQLFLHDDDLVRTGNAVITTLSARLPTEFLGWSTHFGPEDAPIRRMEGTTGPVRHRVDVTSIGAWSEDRLGFDPRQGVTDFDWLATPGQRFAETVGGAVFHDGLNELEGLREGVRWYPDAIWRFVLACQWQRLAQEEAFPGRCAEVGDDLGSRVVTARLVRDVMRLCLLMQRRYVPYGKWLGSAFGELPGAGALGSSLQLALSAATWPKREQHLGRAYAAAVDQHNRLRLTPPVNTAIRGYYDRPYSVIAAGRLATALQQTIADARIRGLPLVGSADQFIDSTDALTIPRRTRAAARAVFGHLR